MPATTVATSAAVMRAAASETACMWAAVCSVHLTLGNPHLHPSGVPLAVAVAAAGAASIASRHHPHASPAAASVLAARSAALSVPPSEAATLPCAAAGGLHRHERRRRPWRTEDESRRPWW